MIELSPLTRQLMADDFASITWLLEVDGLYHTSHGGNLTVDGRSYLPTKFVRVVPPINRNMVDGSQPRSELEVHDPFRSIYSIIDLNSNGSLSIVFTRDTLVSETIVLSRGPIRNKRWRNGIIFFRILNVIDLSESNPTEFTDQYQSKIDSTDTAFKDPTLTTGGWYP